MTSPTTARPTSGETTESREPGAAVGLTREAIQSVIDEMIEVATHEDDGNIPDWPSDNQEQVDKWQVRLSDAIGRSPAPDATVSEPVAYRVIRGGEDGKYTGLYLTRSEAEVWLRAWNRDFNHKSEIEPLYTSPQDVGREATIEECRSIFEGVKNVLNFAIGLAWDAERLIPDSEPKRLRNILNNIRQGYLKPAVERLNSASVNSSPPPASARDAVIEALEPFAKIADHLDRAYEWRVRHYADEGHKAGPPNKDSEYVSIRVGDCRKARAAIRSLAQGAKP